MSGHDHGSADQPPRGQWAPTGYSNQGRNSRPWLAIALAITAIVAVAALILALIRPATSGPSSITKTPTYTAAEVAAAQQRLCQTYQLAAKAVQVDTNASDPALGRVALTNSAVMLNDAATDPALDDEYRSAAKGLARAYLVDTAKSSSGAASDADFRAAVDDVNAKDAIMKKVCGGA
ncbi:hypothetical protein U8D42_21625 [Mycobacterium europaeum]|nr:hypothetical protein [Mycobacterium europaeum]MEA1158044.1 hypothetical protein [Mycobacterium europaeum]